MLKKNLMAIVLSVFLLPLKAQVKTEIVPVEKEKIVNYYIGVQANQLFRQIINLNNNNTAVTNPYLLTGVAMHNETGWCVNIGLGYDFRQTEDKDAPANRITKANDNAMRIGVGKRVIFGKRLEAGFGVDFAMEREYTKTFSTTVTNFGSGTDSTNTENETEIVGIGGGPQLNLSFRITKNLLIGTEATYYFIKSVNKEHVFINEVITDTFNGTSISTSSNESLETEIQNFSLTVPVALFLIIKF